MPTWSSSPYVPHTGGTFDFPENTSSSDIVYTITYTDDDNCSTSTTYTVKGIICPTYTICPSDTTISGGIVAFSPTTGSCEPTCDCTAVHVSPSQTGKSSGGSVTFGSFSDSACTSQITFVSSDPTWLSGEITGINGLLAVVSANTSTSSRTATLTVKVGTNECGTCTFTQSGATSTCACRDMSFIPGPNTGFNWDSSARNELIGRVSDACASEVTFSTIGSGWLSGETRMTEDGYMGIWLVVPQNTSTSSRNSVINIGMGSSNCKTTSVKQSGATW